MTRRRNQRVQVQSADTAERTGVYAPSYVRTQSRAANQANALSGFLQTALRSGSQIVRMQQADDLAEGQLAAEMGDVDESTLRDMEKSAAWVLGAERTLGKARAVADTEELYTAYESEFDKSGTTEQLQQFINERLASKYEGMDPGIARQVAPILAKAEQELLAKHATAQVQETAAEVQNALSTTTADRLGRLGDEPFAEGEWAAMRDEYKTLYANREDAMAALGADVAFAAVQARDESMLELPQFQKLRENPRTRGLMEKAHAEARTARIKDFQDQTRVERGLAYAEVDSYAQTGDIDKVVELATKYGTPNEDGYSLLTEGEVQAAIVTSVRARQTAGLTGSYADAWGNAQADMIPDKYRDEAASAWYQKQVEENPEQADRLLVQSTLDNGYVPEFMKDRLEMASPTNPEAFDQAYSIWKEAETYYPGELDRYIKDDAYSQFKAYDKLRRDYGPEQALEVMRSHDRTLYEQFAPVDRREALGRALNDVTDIPWSLREVEETPRLKREIEDEIRYFAGFDMDLDDATEAAVESVAKRFTYVDGNLYSKSAGWGQDPEAAADWYKESQGGNVRLVPVPGEPGMVQVQSTDSLLDIGGGQRVPIKTIAAGYADVQEVRRNEAAAAANAEKHARYEEKAKRRLYGVRSMPTASRDPGSIGATVARTQDEMWDALSEAEKAAVYREIEAEEKADAEFKARMRRLDRERREAFDPRD